MADTEDLPSDSDTSDEDYTPGLDGEVVSEEEESGDDEGAVGVQSDGSPVKGHEGGRGKRRKQKPTHSRKRRGGIKLEGEEETDETSNAEAERQKELKKQIEEERKSRQEKDEKKKSDDLWDSFLSDVGTRPACSSSKFKAHTKEKIESPSGSKSETKPKDSGGTVTITKEFDFAGETVKVTKEVAADSKEAKKQEKKEECKEEKPATKKAEILSGAKRPGGGLGSLLGKISKKPKMSTLEKSKLDWNSFKQEEGIEEELQIYNRGKSGFIERQAFLQRTDERQFEKERDIRLGLSGKR